jgi:tRNA(fMet)-specific endonuclease VapC
MDDAMAAAELLIDTSILIDYLRKSQKQQTLFYRLSSQFDYSISSITHFEFMVGATPNNRPFIQQLLQDLPVLAFDIACANQAAAIHQELKMQNQLLPMADILIAATAITYDSPLLTLNRKHFERIKLLKLHDTV